ncbi:MAG: ATP-binding protein [Balneolaceae bacterium]|nr:ATP-binding protein [Balneolaceae bacterium]
MRELATCRFIDQRQGVIITGPPGTGKTHLRGTGPCRLSNTRAIFLFNQLFQHSELLLEQENMRRWRKLISHDLLIIDDFAFRRISQAQSEQLYQLVDTCHGNTSIILTSNRALPDWLEGFSRCRDWWRYPGSCSRCHNAHQITLKGESIRKKWD